MHLLSQMQNSDSLIIKPKPKVEVRYVEKSPERTISRNPEVEQERPG